MYTLSHNKDVCRNEARPFIKRCLQLEMAAEGGAEGGAAKEAIWEPLMRDLAAEARQQPAVEMNESRCVCVRVLLVGVVGVVGGQGTYNFHVIEIIIYCSPMSQSSDSSNHMRQLGSLESGSRLQAGEGRSHSSKANCSSTDCPGAL